jgi:hypothetical protein
MTKRNPIAPEQNVRDYANELAIDIARKKLAGIPDLEAQCARAGASYDAAAGAALLPYLDRTVRITLPAGEVAYTDGETAVSAKDTILVLDYFTRAGGAPLTGNLITYQELHDGLNYFGVFSTRTTRPLIQYFGREPEKFLAAAKQIGGAPADFGDVAVTFTAFPHAPLTYVLWKGDDEFPPDASILFDSTVSDYLSNDDIHNLCESIVWRLVRLSKSGGDHAG